MINDRKTINFIRERINFKSDILGRLEEYAKENRVPILEKESAAFIRQMVMLKNPGYILEIGTAIGYSSILMALSGDVKGIDTLEKSPHMAALATENIKDAGLSNIIKVHEGDGLEILEDHSLRRDYDLVFIDAAKAQYSKFFKLSMDRVKEDALIICDNIFMGGMTVDYENTPKRNRTMVRNMISFVDEIAGDERFNVSIIPIGDGVALIQQISKDRVSR